MTSDLLDPSSLFVTEEFSVVKARVAGKSTLVRGGAAGPEIYLKRITQRSWLKSLRGRFAGRAYRSSVSREWLALNRLQELGICAPRPLMMAEESRFGLVRRACLLTEALPQADNLEELVLAGLPSARKERIAIGVAEVLVRMHEGGINHRDFYLGHLRVDADDRIQVLDLDRADLREPVPMRWRVKDLAALDFSTPRRTVGVFERLRFLCRYARATSLDARALAIAVTEKSSSIRAHAERKIARGDANIHINE
ncbi:MAG: lipopolysaccharide kinase InaA family protein [Planctomycetota bacterium]